MATESGQLQKVYDLCVKFKDFQQQWEGLYHHQTMKYVRVQCEDLLSESLWKDIVMYQNNGENEAIRKYATGLLRDVIKHFDEKIEKASGGFLQDKMMFQLTRDDLEKNYGNDPYRFIDNLVRCLKEEELLINKFMQPSEEQLQQENKAHMIHFFTETETLDTKLKREVKDFCSYIEQEEQLLSDLSKNESTMNELEANSSRSSRRGKNGVNPEQALEKLRQERDRMLLTINNTHQEVENIKHAIKNTLRDFHKAGVELQKRFSVVITKWKRQSQLKYVHLAEEDYNLDGMDDRCKQFGKLLMGTLQYIHNNLLVLSNGKWDMENDVDLKTSINSLFDLFKVVCQSTFLVTGQTRHLIKVELGQKKRTKDQTDDDDVKPGKSFKCPKFSADVRLIATEEIMNRPKVRAYFCHEDLLNQLHRDNDWSRLEKESFPMMDRGKSRTMPFAVKGLACFNSLELTNFKRDQDKHVCEEKYRIVFTTEQEVAGRTLEFRTLSLPIIITTGASQGSNAHGSLLWQCFSQEDVMEFPLTTQMQLPWATVSSMVNHKFKMLGGRDLRSDELLHLASRLTAIPRSNINPQTEIQFRKFCLDKMMDVKESKEAKNKSATFWMWVLAVYNLTNNYLKEYWVDGVIDGFSSKEDSEEKLKTIKPFKNHTFLLRFSNNIITDGQGQNMCGAISVSFVFTAADGNITVGHAKPFNADKLKEKDLGRQVRSIRLKEINDQEVQLKCVLAGNKTRDDVFTANYQPSCKKKTSEYLEFEERLYYRVKELSLEDRKPKVEPSQSEYPVAKKTRQTATETTDPMMTETAMLDKYDQASPASTFSSDILYSRNSSESMPMSHEPSPASSYNIMSPEPALLNDARYTGISYSASSPLSTVSNGMNCASPQSSVDESQILSPEQEATIPVVVLDEISQNSPLFCGNPNTYSSTANNGYNNGNHSNAYHQSGQNMNLHEQHPTLTNLLRNPQQLEDLKKKIMERNNLGQASQQIEEESMENQIDLNSVQREITQMEISNIARTLEESYPAQPADPLPAQSQMTFTQLQDMNFPANIGQEVEIPHEITTGIQVNANGDWIINPQQLNLDPNANMVEQLQQMVPDQEQAQNYGNLMNVLSELLNTSSGSVPGLNN